MMTTRITDIRKKMEQERNVWGSVLESSNLDAEIKEPLPGTQALWRGLSVLKIIAETPEPVRFSSLIELSGLAKGTLHRILQALIAFRMIRLNETDQTYQLGSRLFEMAHQVWNNFDLRGAAEPEMLRLQTLSSESTCLGIIEHSKVLVIDQKETLHPLRLGSSVGKNLHLHASALGKAILSHMGPVELNAYLQQDALTPLTDRTITHTESLKRHLHLIKARGYAISTEEEFEGIHSVAAPILDHYGKPLGAIAITGGAYRLSEEKLHNLGRDVIESARRISGNVGESFMSIHVNHKPGVKSESRWRCEVPSQAFLGEGPHWNVEQNRLEWVDILEPSAHLSIPESGLDTKVQFPEIVGAMVPREKGGHIAVTQFGYRAVDLSDGTMTPIASPDDLTGCRFNDGKCDAKGRFWAGTLALDAAPNKGALYCLDKTGQLEKKLSGLHISNGLGWNKESDRMYLTDSGKGIIYVMDFDLSTGELDNQRVFAKLGSNDGSPDGLAVDNDGCIWSAIWDGWRVIRFDPDGVIDRVVDLPIPRPTSCAFGGNDMSTLYVTSARIRLSAGQLAEAPLSGSVFAVDTDTSGVPVATFSG